MRIEDLTSQQLARLREAKAEVMRAGFLHSECTDQEFLNAMAVHRRTRGLLETLGSAMNNPKITAMNKAFESFARMTEHLWDQDGVWDTDGWRSS